MKKKCLRIFSSCENMHMNTVIRKEKNKTVTLVETKNSSKKRATSNILLLIGIHDFRESSTENESARDEITLGNGWNLLENKTVQKQVQKIHKASLCLCLCQRFRKVSYKPKKSLKCGRAEETMRRVGEVRINFWNEVFL